MCICSDRIDPTTYQRWEGGQGRKWKTIGRNALHGGTINGAIKRDFIHKAQRRPHEGRWIEERSKTTLVKLNDAFN